MALRYARLLCLVHDWQANPFHSLAKHAAVGCQQVTKMIKPKSQLLFNPSISEETI